MTVLSAPCLIELVRAFILLTLALCFVAVAVVFADDANMGTWKLNEAKSMFASGATKNSTVVYEAAGDNVKVIVDGTDKDVSPPTTSGRANSTGMTIH